MKKLFSENLGLKLFSLVLAALLEFYFYSSENAISETIIAQAQLRNLSSDMMEVGPSLGKKGTRIRLRVSGPSQLIERMRLSPVKYIVNLPETLEENYIAEIDPENFTLPIGVKILDYHPRDVEFAFEKILRKNLKIELVKSGVVAKGFEIKRSNTKPPSIYVKGPVSELQGLTQVKTKPVEISNVSNTIKREVRLEPVGPYTTMDVNIVSADIEISPILEKRVFRRVPIKLVMKTGQKGRVHPEFVSVDIIGPVNGISDLKMEEVVVKVDARKINLSQKKSAQVPLTVSLPEGYLLEASSPEIVELSLLNEVDAVSRE